MSVAWTAPAYFPSTSGASVISESESSWTSREEEEDDRRVIREKLQRRMQSSNLNTIEEGDNEYDHDHDYDYELEEMNTQMNNDDDDVSNSRRDGYSYYDNDVDNSVEGYESLQQSLYETSTISDGGATTAHLRQLQNLNHDHQYHIPDYHSQFLDSDDTSTLGDGGVSTAPKRLPSNSRTNNSAGIDRAHYRNNNMELAPPVDSHYYHDHAATRGGGSKGTSAASATGNVYSHTSHSYNRNHLSQNNSYAISSNNNPIMGSQQGGSYHSTNHNNNNNNNNNLSRTISGRSYNSRRYGDDEPSTSAICQVDLSTYYASPQKTLVSVLYVCLVVILLVSYWYYLESSKLITYSTY